MSAIHEAGHAVTAVALGLHVAYVTPAVCELSLLPTDLLDSFLTAAVAGGIAANIAYPGGPMDPSPGDLALIERYKSRLVDPLWPYSAARPELLANRLVVAQSDARAILVSRWPSLELLAAELTRRGYLTGVEAVKLIR